MHQGRQRSALTALLLASSVGAAETVVLRNGFHLEAERLEREPDRVRLLQSTGGWIDVPVGEVLRIVPGGRAPAQAVASNPIPVTKPSESTAHEIDRLADQAGLPRALVRAVVRAESGNRHDAVSPKGAVGLMQLMPATAADLGVDPTNPIDNIRGGTLYLRQMLDRYKGNQDQLAKALAAYNAGPGRVDEYGGLPPYPETIAYVARVVRDFLSSERAEEEGGAGEPTPHQP